MSKLSIITINFNNKTGLEETIQSVVGQSYHQFEYIIVDGGSTDGSVDVIKKYEPYINKWVSEPDKGIYNAMNKGTMMASGEYCLFLNSGDKMHDKYVMKNAYAIIKDRDIYFGELLNIWKNSNNGVDKIGKWQLRHDITLQTIYEGAIPHAGSFIKRSLMIKYPYCEDLKICSDRKFFIQSIVFDNCSYAAFNHIVCDFDMSGVSGTQDELLYNENIQILRDLLPERIVQDYLKTNLTLQNLTSKLVQYRKCLTTLVCNIDNVIIGFYKLIRHITKK